MAPQLKSTVIQKSFKKSDFHIDAAVFNVCVC